ncbi:WD40-repeat-containing domain protein [Boletus edulis]|nr:WD40-repeat-containing domain protein [Boletus edulis]
MATMAAEQVGCVAFSKNCKWIAAGTYWGDVIVWDAKVYKQPFTTWTTVGVIRGVDFSPDSTRLLALGDRTVTVWDITTRERVVGPLSHDDRVWAAKYSPQGDRIATATQKSLRVYDSNDGRLLVNIQVQITTHRYNTSLVWSNNNVFVVSDGKIKQIDASTGSQVSEWPVPDLSALPCITVPQHGGFIACTANQTVTFWDTSTHTQIGLFRHQYPPQDVHSIALSPDGRFLMLGIGGENEKITAKRLSRITEPDIQIDDAALDLWKNGQLEEAQALLTEATLASQSPHHHVLASRAIVRARLRQWGAAIEDAKKSIEIQPSIGGYIANSVAFVSRGEKYKAYRACDIAFEHCHPTRAVIVCMAGEHLDAISRVDDLIDTLHLNSTCYVVQAYMHLLHGKSLMRNRSYQDAVKSFKDARNKLQHHTSQTLSVVSLISGWKFDELDITLQQCLCKALYAAGHTKEAGESLLTMINTIDGEVYMRRSSWVSDFLQQYLSIRESRGGATSEVAQDENTSMLYAPTLLLKEWAKLKLARGSWQDVLASTDDVSVHGSGNPYGPDALLHEVCGLKIHDLSNYL